MKGTGQHALKDTKVLHSSMLLSQHRIGVGCLVDVFLLVLPVGGVRTLDAGGLWR